MRTVLVAIAAGLLATGGATAAYADTPETYNFTIPYTLSNFINYNEYTLGSPGISYGIGSFAPGEGSYTENISPEAGAVTLTTIMGTSSLENEAGTSSSFRSQAAVSPNHLVIAVDPTFYATKIGDPTVDDRSFNTVFNTSLQESDIVGALNTINNPGSSDTSAAFNTLFSFANVLKGDSATFSPNSAFDLVSFSDGKLFGAGTVSFVPAAGAVPEPASWAMMIMGMGMVGCGMRYCRRSTVLRYMPV